MKVNNLWLVCLVLSLTDAFRLAVPNHRRIALQHQKRAIFRTHSEYDATSSKSTVNSHSVTARMAASPDEEGSSASLPISNAIFGLMWIALLVFTAFIAPGSFESASDNEMILKIIENPLHPDINALYYFLFNLFVIIPACLACVIFPQASDKGAPPAPFLIGSTFLGYFVLGKAITHCLLGTRPCLYIEISPLATLTSKGPYLFIKGKSKDSVVFDELNWVTQNVLENKAFNWFQVVAFIYFAVTYAVIPALEDFTSLLGGFQELISSSKFACVSVVDLTLLSITAAALIPQDYKLRNPQNASNAALIGAGSLFLPVLGSALYCALRPQLPKSIPRSWS